MKTIAGKTTGYALEIALMTAVCFGLLLNTQANAVSNATSADSTSSREAAVESVQSKSAIKNPYSVYPRFDPNSSVRKRNPAPNGYLRISADSVRGFGNWLRDYPMRSDAEPLTTYTGAFLADPASIGGVLDMPITSPGFDARGLLYPLMHEYAQVTGREMELKYRGLADDSISLLHYLTGTYKTNYSRTKYMWTEGTPKALDEAQMKRFTEFARSVTSYRSLIRDSREIAEEDLLPGDLFIQTDSTPRPDAHLSIAIDVATLAPDADVSKIARNLKDKDGKPYKRIFLFANGLTPASAFHIIRPIKPGKGNWIVPGELEDKLKHVGPGRFYRLQYQFLR